MGRVAEKVRVFLDLVRFEHSVFALPYAYIGALYGATAAYSGAQWTDRLRETPARLAGTRVAIAYSGQENPWIRLVPSSSVGESLLRIAPTLTAIFWITLVMVGARSFAFVLNRAIDAEIDARNPRTAGRAIPAGKVKTWELWLFAAATLAVYLVGVWQLAPIVRWLWPIPLVAFFIYPYTKRFTPLCHYWLGLCLGLAPIGGWIAVGGPVAHPAPWLLGGAVTLWTAGFDIIYATQDVECDMRDKVHSMPADLGIARALVHTRVAHVLTVALLLVGGWLAGAGVLWYAGVLVAALLLAYENLIVNASNLTRVNAAFFTVNGIIAIVVFVGALADTVIA